MDEGKYIRGLSDYELMRMLNIDRDRYTQQEIAIAEDEMERRKLAGAPKESAEPAAPVEEQPGRVEFYIDTLAKHKQNTNETGLRERAGERAKPKDAWPEAVDGYAGDVDEEEDYEDEGEFGNEHEPASGTVQCMWCGRELPGDAKYCMECGKKVRNEGVYGAIGRLDKRLINATLAVLSLIVLLLVKCN